MNVIYYVVEIVKNIIIGLVITLLFSVVLCSVGFLLLNKIEYKIFLESITILIFITFLCSFGFMVRTLIINIKNKG